MKLLFSKTCTLAIAVNLGKLLDRHPNCAIEGARVQTRGKMDISFPDKTKARIYPCLLLLRKTHS
jgi:hypothetical protein